jgi:hypothetical protein
MRGPLGLPNRESASLQDSGDASKEHYADQRSKSRTGRLWARAHGLVHAGPVAWIYQLAWPETGSASE